MDRSGFGPEPSCLQSKRSTADLSAHHNSMEIILKLLNVSKLDLIY